uniref:ABC transmembrane type-1 domain-containing protein n=1 Tax=Heterorhabditis bacteriophora TaxID=37862 RepID=A0A1I7XQB6_HETBA
MLFEKIRSNSLFTGANLRGAVNQGKLHVAISFTVYCCMISYSRTNKVYCLFHYSRRVMNTKIYHNITCIRCLLPMLMVTALSVHLLTLLELLLQMQIILLVSFQYGMVFLVQTRTIFRQIIAENLVDNGATLQMVVSMFSLVEIGRGSPFRLFTFFSPIRAWPIWDCRMCRRYKVKDRAHVDGFFFRKLWKILRILVPGIFSPEVLILLVNMYLLTVVQFLISILTYYYRSIIARSKLQFLANVIKYGISMPAISVVNAMLKFGLSELKLRFRERLTKHLYAKYLKDFTFYKMSNLDNRIQNADQLLTQDVDRFCEGIVELYSNLSKPIVDVLLYVSRLGGALGFGAPVILFIYLIGSGIFLTYLRRPIGRLTVQEQALEGEFRFVNSRLIMNSEEIAFYQVKI